MRDRPPFYFGFTLIEVLVSVLVISILFGLGYANFRRYSQRQAVWAAARKIEGDLRKAQSYAMSGKGSCASGYLLGYQFRWLSGTTYQIRGVCRSGGSNSYINSLSVSIPSSFTIGNFNSPSDSYGLDGVVFYTPKGNTSLLATKQVTVSLLSGLFPVSVFITPGGQISVAEQ